MSNCYNLMHKELSRKHKMSDDFRKSLILSNPYKIVDYKRERRKYIAASSFKDFIHTVRSQFEIPTKANLTIVLEQDGTEIDDEDYFATLEKNTSLMILQNNQKWTPMKTKKSTSQSIVVDDITDHGFVKSALEKPNTKYEDVQMGSVLSSINNDFSHISHLSANDLEKLGDMNPDNVADIISDKYFLEQLKEVSNRFLAEKRQAQESIALLYIYSINAGVEQ